MSDFQNPHLKGKSLQELMDALPETALPGSQIFEMMSAAIDAKIAELQIQAADKALRWAKLAAASTTLAAVIAVLAFVKAF